MGGGGGGGGGWGVGGEGCGSDSQVECLRKSCYVMPEHLFFI